MPPARLGPFLLCARLDGHDVEAYRARRVIATGHLSAPLLLEVFQDAPAETADALVAAAAWGARVTHPGVARVLEVGRQEGALYAVSELVEGKDLDAVLTWSREHGAGPSVLASLAIGAQLARIGRQVHEDSGGVERLGSFWPRDVRLGFDGRVRIRARGRFERPVERPASAAERDPFLAPEIARGAAPGPSADAWTVARVLRAALATDPEGRKTPKVSTLYKDSLGPILSGALAREPHARMSLPALERRLLDVLLDTADSPTRLVVELLEEQAGGALPSDDEPLRYEDLERVAVDPGPAGEVLFPATGGHEPAGRPAHVATQVGPPPDVALGGGQDSSLFGRVLQEAEAAIAQVSDDGDALTASGARGPRVSLAHEDELSLDEVPTAASLDVPLALDVDLDRDAGSDMDLDAIARSSLEGADLPGEEPPAQASGAVSSLAVAGTAIVERPAPLPPSQHEDGDVFRSAAPRSSEGTRPGQRRPAPSSPRRIRGDEADDPNDGGDVFTATVRPADLFPELASSSSTRLIRSRSRSLSAEPADPPAGGGTLDPDKTAFLDDPAAAFRSGLERLAARDGAEHAARARAAPVSIAVDDDDQPTERLSEDLIREALKLSPRDLARRQTPEPPRGADEGSASWGQPLAGEGLPSSPQETALLPVHDVREILEARGAAAGEPADEEHPPTLDEVLPEDLELGLLVIDVPEGAVVFVNGDQRGRGRTVLDSVDLFEQFVVRVHHRGHLPWTGTVTLKGMRAARIEPELRRR